MADEIKKMPDEVSADKMGLTQAEEDWRNLPDPRPPVSRWVFFFAGMLIIIACALSGIWYYQTSIVPEKIFARAENYLLDGDYTGAYRLFEEVYETRPKRKDVIFNLGLCLEKMGRFEAAANRYSEHLKKLPDDGKALIQLGNLNFQQLGKKDEGYALLKQGAAELDTAEAWENVVQAAKSFKPEELAEALEKQLKLAKKTDEILAVSKRLAGTGAYKEALGGYEKALDKDKTSEGAQNGVKAMREKLGLPDSKEHTVIPGKALGLVKIGESKQKVKEAMGGKSPDKKLFVQLPEETEELGKELEIWDYNTEQPDRFRIIFIKDKAAELETAASTYKTEDGLSIDNCCTDEQCKAQRDETQKNVLIFSDQTKGLSFYVPVNRKGVPSKTARKLRVHKGEKSVLDDIPELALADRRKK